MRTLVPVLLLAVAAVVALNPIDGDWRRTAALMVAAVAIGFSTIVWWRRRGRRIRHWQDAEHAAARWLRRAGCRQVEPTGAGADGGIDIITDAWAVQVKHTTKRVGRPVLQQVVGASLALERLPAVVSTSGFTAPALDYADEHHVALLELHLDGTTVERVNPVARLVGRHPRRLRRVVHP